MWLSLCWFYGKIGIVVAGKERIKYRINFGTGKSTISKSLYSILEMSDKALYKARYRKKEACATALSAGRIGTYMFLVFLYSLS